MMCSTCRCASQAHDVPAIFSIECHYFMTIKRLDKRSQSTEQDDVHRIDQVVENIKYIRYVEMTMVLEASPDIISLVLKLFLYRYQIDNDEI